MERNQRHREEAGAEGYNGDSSFQYNEIETIAIEE